MEGGNMLAQIQAPTPEASGSTWVNDGLLSPAASGLGQVREPLRMLHHVSIDEEGKSLQQLFAEGEYKTEALDWGSEVEECILPLPLNTDNANHQIESHPSRRNSKDGLCNISVIVSTLYNMSFDVLDVLECEHHFLYKQCEECSKNLNSLWLLDSGASVHFTHNKSDFINFIPAKQSNRQPIRTTAHTIFVEGLGKVLLRHFMNQTLVTT